MLSMIKVIPLLCVCSAFAFGQSKQETIDFIVDEIKSLENKGYLLRDVSFSQGGDIFSFKRYRPGRTEKGVVMALKDVDIFAVPIHHANGPDLYTLEAKSRGRDGIFMANGVKFHGSYTILGRIESERKARALEKAFLRLTVLTTGRKDLFPVP